ncbi:MAG: zinc ABC transporter substrate-binding protein [Methyloligellaceae bacterium]
MKFRAICALGISFMAIVGAINAQANERSGVVASIKPVHSLVAGVMAGVGSPHLIVKGAASPHTYALKPSDAEALENANVVFWVGRGLEAFLGRTIDTLAKDAKAVSLEEAHGLRTHPFRDGGPFDVHNDDQGPEKHKQVHGHKEHTHSEVDLHVWLDPNNAKAMVHEIEEALSRADPANAPKYKTNAAALQRRIDALADEIKITLEPVLDRPFVVFHDAYQYFEKRFGLRAVGSITVSPEKLPGAKRLKQIRSKVEDLGAVCVFSEPQFEPKLVRTVTEGTRAKSAVLDPLGADISNGADLYFTLMQNMARSTRACLSPSS